MAEATKAAPRKLAGSIFIAAGIFLSRISGLIRERVMAHYFGNSPALGAFRAAYRIPNALQNLLGEGVLSASFIPVYSRLLAEKRDEEAGRVAGVVASFLAAGTAVIVAIGVLAAPLLVDVIAIGFEGEVRALTILLVRILFPAMGLLVLAAWCLGVLNSHRRFFISYVAPVLMNVAMIGALVAGALAHYRGSDLVVALTWGVVAGAVLQLGIQLPFVFRTARSLSFGFDSVLAPVRTVFRNLLPVTVSRGVVQISAIVDSMIASILGTTAVSALGFAQTIYMLPISLFGMSIAAAELPEMSSEVGSEEEVKTAIRKRVVSASRRVAFFMIPSAVAFVALGDRIVAILYQTGKFGASDTRYVWYILAGSTVGLLAVTLSRIFVSAFNAMHDTRTPLKFAVARVAFGATAAYLLAVPLRPQLVAFLTEVLRLPRPGFADDAISMGAIGLTIGSGFAGWIEFLLLRRALARKIGTFVVGPTFFLKMWTAALIAAAVAVAVNLSLGRLGIAFLEHPIPKGILVLGIYGLSVLGVAAGLRVEEVSAVKRLLRR